MQQCVPDQHQEILMLTTTIVAAAHMVLGLHLFSFICFPPPPWYRCSAPIMCTLNSTSIGLSSCYVLVFACYPDFTVQGGSPGLFEFYSLL